MTTTMTRRPDPERVARLAGSFDSGAGVNARLAFAAANCTLVSPAPVVGGELPDGTSVQIAVVQCTEADIYPTGQGRFALLKHALERVAAAAGLRWDRDRTRRVDDRSHPHVAEWQAVGRVMQLDGTPFEVMGSKLLDLRDDSEAARRIIESARERATGEKQLRDTRAFIAEHAESKAKNRAIRALGLRSSYSRPELLERPIVVVRLAWTGRTSDPEFARENARALRAQFLGSTAALFGPPPAAERRAVAAPRLARHAAVDETFVDAPAPPSPPPPVDAEADEDDHEAAPDVQRDTSPEQAPAADAPAAAASGFTVPGGPQRGCPIEEADSRTLTYWVARLEKALLEDTSQNPDRDDALAQAMRAELARREGREGREGGAA